MKDTTYAVSSYLFFLEYQRAFFFLSKLKKRKQRNIQNNYDILGHKKLCHYILVIYEIFLLKHMHTLPIYIVNSKHNINI